MSSCHDIREIGSLGALEKLSSHEKYLVLKNHFKASKTFISPKVHLHGCQKSCKIGYLHSVFVYREKKEMQHIVLIVYCFHPLTAKNARVFC